MPKNDRERAEAVQTLREILKPGDSITCTTLHVSSSGMSRSIMLQVIDTRGDKPHIRDISNLVAPAIGARFDRKHGGVRVHGCGMNMHFQTVYSLGRVLFPDGFGIEGTLPYGHRVRPQTREHALELVKAGAVFRGRNGDTSGWDADGGYALDCR